MEIDWENPEVLEDFYSFDKAQLRGLLENFGIVCNIADKVAELRPIAAALKSFVKKHKKTQEAKEVFEKLVIHKTRLEGDTLQIYPDLSLIQEFLASRDNVYDQVNAQEHTYEQINGSNNLKKTQDSNLTNMTENLPLISAGSFNGLQSENPNEFVEKYEIAAASNNWQDQTKIKLFPAHLAGNALAWFTHYSKDKNLNNWNDLKTKFIDTFKPMAQANNLQMILEKKVQKPDQQSLNYFLEILAICKRYDQGITDKQVIQYVIQGLRPEICERILGENTNTLEELECSLKKVELRLNIQNQNREKYNRVISEDRGQGKDNSKERFYSDRHDTRGNDIRALQTEIKTLTNIVSNMNIKGGNYTRRDNNEGQWQNRRTGSEDRRYQEEGYRSNRRVNREEGKRWQHHGQEERRYGGQRSYGAMGLEYQQARGRSPARRVHFDRMDSRGAGQHTRPTPGVQKFCRICRRDNHNTDQCRYRNNGSNRGYNNNFCKICRMTNHSTERCYKNRNEGGHQNQKNV